MMPQEAHRMPACPDPTELERLAEGTHDPAAAGLLQEHIARCDRCRGIHQTARQEGELIQDIRRIVDEATRAVSLHGPASPVAEGGAPADLPPRLAGYQLVRFIGEGATAAVYEAIQPLPRRTVA